MTNTLSKQEILKKAIAKVAEVKETTPEEIIRLVFTGDDWINSLVTEAEKTYAGETN